MGVKIEQVRMYAVSEDEFGRVSNVGRMSEEVWECTACLKSVCEIE